MNNDSDLIKYSTMPATFVESAWPRGRWTAVNATWMYRLGLPSAMPKGSSPECYQALNVGPLRERHGKNWEESEWSLCEDLKPPCLVFSVGLGNNWQFDLAAALRGCEVHSFDPTPELHTKHLRNAARYKAVGTTSIHFHYLGLGASRNVTSDYGKIGLGPVAHLDELIRRYANGRTIDVLKVDCEGCEWEELGYLAVSAPSTLCKVSMLQFEWHFTSALRFGGVQLAHLAFRHLAQHGFRPTAVLQGAREANKNTIEHSLLQEAGATGLDLSGICCYTVHLRKTGASVGTGGRGPRQHSMCHSDYP
jgi:hypothetical protein